MAPTTHGNSSTSSKGSIWCLAIVPNLLRDRTFSIFLTRDIRIMNWTTKLLKPSRVSPTSSMLQNALSSQAWSWELRKFTKWRSSAHDGSTTPQFLKQVHKQWPTPPPFNANIKSATKKLQQGPLRRCLNYLSPIVAVHSISIKRLQLQLKRETRFYQMIVFSLLLEFYSANKALEYQLRVTLV